MDCAEEVSLLRRRLSEQVGIYDLTFDVLQACMTVELDPRRVSGERICELVARTGMSAELWRDRPVSRQESFPRQHWRTICAALSGAFLLAGMAFEAVASGGLLGILAGHGDTPESLPAGAVACYAAAIAVGIYRALPKVWISLRHLRPDMNVLVAISIAGACTLGEWSEGATLAFLFALALLLETWSIARARNAVSALLRISPESAAVVHAHGEHRMPVEQIGVGSVVRVKPGERIPCDGEVVSGASSVDQALVTGESVPVWKAAGSHVFAGTMNGDGAMEIRTTRLASDTTLTRMVRMVESSAKRRAPSEQFVETFARYYTPAVFLLAGLVGLVPPLLAGGGWAHWFYESMVILLISCPCALVISTPVTIVSALASAARRGVLVKGGAFLEEVSKLKAFAFDKTGVLTQGEPRVERFSTLNGRPEAQVLERLAALEMRSEHPLGQAIVSYAEERGCAPLPAVAFQALQGRGAQAEIESETFWVGSSRLLAEKHFDTPELREQLEACSNASHTAVLCGTEREVWALIGLHDPVRAEAHQALTDLRGQGVEALALFTGDNHVTAAAVGAALGIGNVRSELLPDEKAAAVEELRGLHGSVAMVGDGINDAQAMAAASIGIAMGRHATDVALETADVVVMSGQLGKLPFLLRHARHTAAVIRQNVVIALGLKAAFLAMAFSGHATLWMAVAADMGATLLVTFNGLRLLRAKEGYDADDQTGR